MNYQMLCNYGPFKQGQLVRVVNTCRDGVQVKGKGGCFWLHNWSYTKHINPANIPGNRDEEEW